eukprot:TRINITY_DN4157_c0_g2_i2.p1 TRINITY_DN4157_c0_g2~~TRINITY_DN4157_c0_g2_i2.p1  ORF type:complete len:199 (+),score=62.57 TRINITY_DN4157_c0_g2_i2:175-771(+)
MDIQRPRRSKKSFIRKSRVSIIPVKESPAKFSFSQVRDTASSGKTVDFLSLFLNPQAEESKAPEVKSEREISVGKVENKVEATEEDKLKGLLTKGKSISSKEKRREQEQRKRRENFADDSKSKKFLDSDSLAPNSPVVVSLTPVNAKPRQTDFIELLNSLLVPPVIEVNIRMEEAKEDEKAFIVSLSSEQISKEMCKE